MDFMKVYLRGIDLQKRKKKKTHSMILLCKISPIKRPICFNLTFIPNIVKKNLFYHNFFLKIISWEININPEESV